MDVLFQMEPDLAASPPRGEPKMRKAAGGAAEHEAISILLRKGHKVAVPVVDDDGVDLIVNYRTTVQVKSTAGPARQDKRLLITLVRVSRNGGGAPARTQQPALQAHVEVLLALVEGVGWWVIPTREIPIGAYGISLDWRRDRWREAWHVFDEEASDA